MRKLLLKFAGGTALGVAFAVAGATGASASDGYGYGDHGYGQKHYDRPYNQSIRYSSDYNYVNYQKVSYHQDFSYNSYNKGYGNYGKYHQPHYGKYGYYHKDKCDRGHHDNYCREKRYCRY